MDRSMGPGDEQPAVIIGASYQTLLPGGSSPGGEVVPVHQTDDGFLVQRRNEFLGDRIEAARPAAILHLERGEQKQALLDDLQSQLVVLGIKWMGQEVGDLLLAEIVNQFVDILPERHDFPELSFSDVEHHHMHLATILREVSGDLGTEEGKRQMGYFPGAVDGVVVRDGDKIHPPGPGNVIESLGRGIALRAVELAQRPVGRLVGMAGMDVQIGAQSWHVLLYSSSMLRTG